MSKLELFADGIGNLRINDDTVRLEFVSQSGGEAPDHKVTIVMTLQGYARLHNSVNRGMKSLVESGRAKQKKKK